MFYQIGQKNFYRHIPYKNPLLGNIFFYFGVTKQQGPVVRKVDSAIHRIVIFSTVVKMLQKL